MAMYRPSWDTLRLRLKLSNARAAQRLTEELLVAERRLTGEMTASLKQSVGVLQHQLERGSGTTAEERPGRAGYGPHRRL